jgi:hypothetical protein
MIINSILNENLSTLLRSSFIELLLNYYVFPSVSVKNSLLNLTRKWNEIKEIEDDLIKNDDDQNDNFLFEQDFKKFVFIFQIEPIIKSFKTIISKYSVLNVSNEEDNKFLLSILKFLKVSIEYSIINEDNIFILVQPLKKMLNGLFFI